MSRMQIVDLEVQTCGYLRNYLPRTWRNRRQKRGRWEKSRIALILARSSSVREEMEIGALSVLSLMREGIEALDELLKSDKKEDEEHFRGKEIHRFYILLV